MFALVIITLSSIDSLPVLDKITIYETAFQCNSKIIEIYKEKRKLIANYPVSVKLEKDQKSHNMLTFIYKEDYNKPKKTGIYRCIKTH